MLLAPDTPLPPLTRLIRWARSVLFFEYWMVGIVDQPIHKALTWTQAPPIRWISPYDKNRYLADPFPWPGSDNTLVCETYDTALRVGRIAALKLDGAGIADEIAINLPLTGHLSFPFLFLSGGQVYAMPESSCAQRLEIFHWQQQTGSWLSVCKVFDNKPVADAILFEKDDLFWIAYTDVTHDPHDNLNLVYASDLAGPWTAHPANPVQRGRDRCRGAGALFTAKGKLYRPTQDCSDVYGGSLRIMEITACTTSTYQEREAAHIVPSSRDYPDGFHTLSAWGDKCLVDGMRLIFSPKLVFNKIWRRLKHG